MVKPIPVPELSIEGVLRIEALPKVYMALALPSPKFKVSEKRTEIEIDSSCGRVVRDFESEAKTRCNFQF